MNSQGSRRTDAAIHGNWPIPGVRWIGPDLQGGDSKAILDVQGGSVEDWRCLDRGWDAKLGEAVHDQRCANRAWDRRPLEARRWCAVSSRSGTRMLLRLPPPHVPGRLDGFLEAEIELTSGWAPVRCPPGLWLPGRGSKRWRDQVTMRGFEPERRHAFGRLLLARAGGARGHADSRG